MRCCSDYRDWQYGWAERVPSLKLNPAWSLTIIPPCGGALVRFLVDHNDHRVSIYLDVDNSLGSMPEPYWEVYCMTKDSEPTRCFMHETEELYNLIEAALNSREGEPR